MGEIINKNRFSKINKVIKVSVPPQVESLDHVWSGWMGAMFYIHQATGTLDLGWDMHENGLWCTVIGVSVFWGHVFLLKSKVTWIKFSQVCLCPFPLLVTRKCLNSFLWSENVLPAGWHCTVPVPYTAVALYSMDNNNNNINMSVDWTLKFIRMTPLQVFLCI